MTTKMTRHVVLQTTTIDFPIPLTFDINIASAMPTNLPMTLDSLLAESTATDNHYQFHVVFNLQNTIDKKLTEWCVI